MRSNIAPLMLSAGDAEPQAPALRSSIEKLPKKKAKKLIRREDSPIVKKLIKKLSAPIPQQISSDSTISLQTFPKMDVNSINFRELNDRIIKAEGDNQKTVLQLIHSYYYFRKGYRLWFDHYKKTYSDNTSNFLVNDKIRECFPD
ncbi:16141_t:CDS:2 [Funneliformis caledonium]|uniref:16141_t:CDS:1 n=1 Tax=Funneliformis caledonium TaxID=1117310 RepID=A0A9N9CDR5_9GLOM|nr:16141_t:CDS:2 [Funneliformis caledonium]